MPWDPNQYLKYAGPRLQPALDLLNRIGAQAPGTVLDLGCGPGNVTALLAQRWPNAVLTAVDNDRAMLHRASDEVPTAQLVEADIAAYEPPEKQGVIYSNATLHWLDDHSKLFPLLLTWLTPGGELAVQMPSPDAQATHVTAWRMAQETQWSDRLLPELRRGVVLRPEQYLDLLSESAGLDVWATTYFQILTGDDPVTEWAKGSFLRPLLAQLDEGEQHDFLARYSATMGEHYPQRPDGTTVLPYTRLFMVARAGD